MGSKITFVTAQRYDKSTPNNGFDPEKESIIVGEGYTFEDWLSDHGVRFVEADGVYHVQTNCLNEDEFTGEAYMVISEEFSEAAATEME